MQRTYPNERSIMATERKKKIIQEDNKKKKVKESTKSSNKKNKRKPLPKLQELMEGNNVVEKCVACYVRVSTDAQAEQGYSIPDQIAKLQAFCTVKGWENVKFYTDPGFSGSNLNRPAMQEMIADAKEEKLKAVIVFKLDRLSRSQKDTLYLIEDVFLPNDVDFVSISEALDTTTPYGRAMIGILSVFAQLERENIFMRTRIGMLGRVSAGYWRGGGNVPFGYDYDKPSKSLVPNADSPKIPQIFDLYLKGYSCQKIADMFGLCNEFHVRNILKRHTYCGFISYKGKEYPGFHPPLIDEETFLRVAVEMERRGKNNISISGDNKHHLLTGLVYCGDCGARMRYMKWGKYDKIICYSRTGKENMIRDPNCLNMGIRASELEKLVVSKLFGIGSSFSAEELEKRKKPISALELLERRRKDAMTSLGHLYDLYANAPDSVLINRIREMREQISTLERQIADEEQYHLTEGRIQQTCEKVQRIGDIWPSLTPMERQTLIRDCVDKIIVYHDGKVEVFYSFYAENESKTSQEEGA